MLRTSIQGSFRESSLFYLVLAAASFQRATDIRGPNARRTLRDMGREYIAKASFGPKASFGLCVPKIRFCNIRGEGHRELGRT
jgi:hypothetical protein